MKEQISKLKSLAQINQIYKDYLYDEDDKRPFNELLKKNGFKPLDQLKVKLKENLDGNYKECEGQTYTIRGFSSWGINDVIFWVDEIDGEFEFNQVEKVI